MNKIVFQTPEKEYNYLLSVFNGNIPNKNDIIMIDGENYIVSERIFDPKISEVRLIMDIQRYNY